MRSRAPKRRARSARAVTAVAGDGDTDARRTRHRGRTDAAYVRARRLALPALRGTPQAHRDHPGRPGATPYPPASRTPHTCPADRARARCGSLLEHRRCRRVALTGDRAVERPALRNGRDLSAATIPCHREFSSRNIREPLCGPRRRRGAAGLRRRCGLTRNTRLFSLRTRAIAQTYRVWLGNASRDVYTEPGHLLGSLACRVRAGHRLPRLAA